MNRRFGSKRYGQAEIRDILRPGKTQAEAEIRDDPGNTGRLASLLGSRFLFNCSDTFAVDASFSHNAQRHRQTDGRTINIMMPIADHTACSTIG